MEEENKNNSDYVKGLENIVKTLFSSLDSIPLKIVIELLSGKRVIDFDRNNEQHKFILDKLKDLATKTQKLIESGRFQIETKGKTYDLGQSAKAALNTIVMEEKVEKINDNIQISKLTSSYSEENSLGYPQFVFQYEDVFCYITIKTHSYKKEDLSENYFNLSHIENVTEDALHFVISFNISKIDNIYNWSIIQIGNVIADIQREFVFSNRRIYRDKNILAKRYG